MKPRHTLTRRSFFRRVVGGLVIAGSAMGVVADPAEAMQTTDGDAGASADPRGRGRSTAGLTDRDVGFANRDPIGLGRGNRRRGITDTDSGSRGDPANRGRGTTDADRSDRPGYGRGIGQRPGGPRGTSTGTGFFVGAEGEIVTSAHVVQGAQTIFVTNSAGQRVEARVLRSSTATDIAVLSIGATPPRYLTLSSSRGVQSGARVFTVGFPVADLLGREPRYTEGTISALSGPGGDQTFFQISVPVQPGNSGGPLLSERGEVIGIVAASAAVAAFLQATGTLPQNVNWAVKSDYAAPMLGETTSITYPTREAAIAAANAAVVFIEAERGAPPPSKR